MDLLAVSSNSLGALQWLAVVGTTLGIAYHRRARIVKLDLAREVVLGAVAYFAYFGVRGLTEGGKERALTNAGRVVSFERGLHMDYEGSWQNLIVDHHGLVTLFNWIYIWGHWPVIVVTAFWLYFHAHGTYRLYRNAFVISGAVGLVVFVLFPVAPPRLFDAAMVDTVTEYSYSYRVLQPPQFVNQYAAMPSLHFGWNLLIGIAVVTTAPSVYWKLAAMTLSTLMFVAVVLTANHYIIDPIAGAIVALGGLAASAWWSRIHHEPESQIEQRRQIGSQAASHPR